MSRGINKVILVGHLGQDPELKYMPSGGAVVSLSLATSENWKDKTSGEKQEKTEWHRVVFFNKLAEIAGEYLKKGAQIYVEGSLRTRKWQKEGMDQYTTEIVGNELQMLGSVAAAGKGSSAPSANASAHRAPMKKAAGSDVGGNPMDMPFDDDIPF